MNKQILAILVSFVLGAVIAYLFFGVFAGTKLKAENETLRQIIEEQLLGTGFDIETGEALGVQTLSLSGTTKEIKSNSLVMDADVSPVLVALYNAPETREVLVSADTQIVKRTPKDFAVYQGELEAYQNAMTEYEQKAFLTEEAEDFEATTELVAPEFPDGSIEEQISLADLSVGDFVTVFSETDITRDRKFEAIKIVVETNITLVE